MRVRFGDFALDRAARQLFRGTEELHLEPKAFELLTLLLERRPEAVSKIEIRDRLWPDTFVSESNLTGLVAQIRKALRDGRRQPRFVRTVHGLGYAFTGEASEHSAGGTSQRPSRTRVIWEERVIPLGPGENVLGRDEGATVHIDLPGVSRRHARIVIEEGRATLEDLGSKNGTFLNELRLEKPAALADGDTFRLGRHLLVFRNTPLAASTRSEIGGNPGSSRGRPRGGAGDDRTIRLWPVPDVRKTPPHKRRHQEFMAMLRSFTNLRAVADPGAPSGYKLEPGPIPGWAKAPEW